MSVLDQPSGHDGYTESLWENSYRIRLSLFIHIQQRASETGTGFTTPWLMMRRVKPRRLDAATRVSLALLSRLFEWRTALVVVRPETLIRYKAAIEASESGRLAVE